MKQIYVIDLAAIGLMLGFALLLNPFQPNTLIYVSRISLVVGAACILIKRSNNEIKHFNRKVR